MTKQEFDWKMSQSQVAVHVNSNEEKDEVFLYCRNELGLAIYEDFYEYSDYPYIVLAYGKVLGWTGQGSGAPFCEAQKISYCEFLSIIKTEEEDTMLDIASLI